MRKLSSDNQKKEVRSVGHLVQLKRCRKMQKMRGKDDRLPKNNLNDQLQWVEKVRGHLIRMTYCVEHMCVILEN